MFSGRKADTRLTAGALVLALAAVLVFGAAYAYARSQNDVIADGIRVAGIDVGGLSASAARERLTRTFAPLKRPLVLHYPHGRIIVTADRAGVRLDSAGLVARAVALSHGSWFLPQAWRNLTGADVNANVQPRVEYSRSAVRQVVRDLQRRIDRRQRNATLVPTFDRLVVRKGRRGVAVAARLLHREIRLTLSHRTAPRLLAVPI